MILNYSCGVAFIHIPKCAGSAVKDQLRAIDETGGRYERAEPHPDYGRVHRAHLPLWLLRDLYPEDFSKLKDVEAYAVLRDPQARFASALAQRIEQFGKRDPFALSSHELRREIETVLNFLEAQPRNPTLEFCHFIRQVDFVDFRGERLVRHLYRVEDVERMMHDIGAQMGQRFVTGRANQKLDFRHHRLKAPAYAANRVLRSVLPSGVYAAVKQRATGLLARQGKSPVWQDALASSEVHAFVEAHYAADRALFETAS